MEEKINQEIRNYSEVMFFGLTMRQTVFSALAVVVAVLLYFLLRPYFGLETLSWVCILGAAPFAALGFVSYHGMTAEKLLWVWIRSELLEPRHFPCAPKNLYYEMMKDSAAVRREEAKRNHVKTSQRPAESE